MSTTADRHFEDCEVGQAFDLGSHTVTEEGILEFAERYDPQPFHVDREAAEESMFGGLVASGWHTAALCQRLLVDGLIAEMARGGGRGVDDLRWHRPVRPGDTVSLSAEIVETDASAGMPGFGAVDMDLVATNQDGDAVLTWTLLGLVEQRDP